ncbi:FGGY-family carbohydrate kinase, partial [candidate division KSB1 bacterium]
CGALGTGIVREGRIQASLGTSGTVVAHTDSVKVEPEMKLHTFCHTVPGAWYLMGVVLQAGGSFKWFRDTLAIEEIEAAKKENTDPYNILFNKAVNVPIGSEGLLFLPYLSGERTPHQDGKARGAWVGLTLTHSKEHLVRAVIEGITFAMRDSVELMRTLGIEVSQVRIIGGGAKNPLWRQMQADVYNAEVVTVSSEEGPAFGAAILAGTGAGIYSDVRDAADEVIKPVDSYIPNPENVKIYEEYYQIFRELYPSLKDGFAKL